MTKKSAGKVLPAGDPSNSQEVNEENAMKILRDDVWKDLIYNESSVQTVNVTNGSSYVDIDGKSYFNEKFSKQEYEKVLEYMRDSKMNILKLKESDESVASRMKIIFKHLDFRSHSLYLRKCHPKFIYQCDYCKKCPVKGSDLLWRALPLKENGGLFYDNEEDENNNGHYAPILRLLAKYDREGKIKITPDSMIPEVKRCQVG